MTHWGRRVFRLEVKEYFHVKQALSHLTIDGTKEVQWQGKLEDQLIDHDQVADGHRATDYTLCGHEHHQSQSTRVNRILSGIEEGE